METDRKKELLGRIKESAKTLIAGSGKGKVIGIAILVLTLVLSRTVVANYVSSPDIYKSMMNSLDTKRNQVLSLVAVSTAASTIITALPGDTGNPVADKLADMSNYFLVILGAIFLERILLTIGGYIVFRYGVPIICILLIIGGFIKEKRWKSFCQEIAVKLILLCIILGGITPASIKLSSLVENTQTDKINESIESVNNTMEALNDTDIEGEEEKGFWEGAASKLSEFAEGVTNGVSEIMDTVKNSLNNLIDIIAIFIVTTCILPLIVLVTLIVFVKWLLGNIQIVDSKYVEVKNAEIKQVDFPKE